MRFSGIRQGQFRNEFQSALCLEPIHIHGSFIVIHNITLRASYYAQVNLQSMQEEDDL